MGELIFGLVLLALPLSVWIRYRKLKKREKKVTKFSEDLIKSRSKWNTRN